MNKELSVKISGISKKYYISERSRYLALRDMFVKVLKLPVNLLKGKKFKKKDEFWALKDINIDVKPGEVIGIIGRNGAGKSTLLKILSRITDPTEGTIEYKGRISSLLEVGTGFHPELTGRENIFLNGAILGMKRTEILTKLEDIIEFSGIRDFIDMPVKKYSSGMQVRLAFSVAAHLESEILVIDEVLAVGDAEFQKKCLGKMDEVTKANGRTVFFVSHDMGAIQRLCTKVIWIDKGEVKFFGETNEAISRYIDMMNNVGSEVVQENDLRKELKILKVKVTDTNGKSKSTFTVDEPYNVEVEYAVNTSKMISQVAIIMDSSLGARIFSSASSDTNASENKPKENGIYHAQFNYPKTEGITLNPGLYWIRVSLGMANSKPIDSVENIPITFSPSTKEDSTYVSNRMGAVNVNSTWKL